MKIAVAAVAFLTLAACGGGAEHAGTKRTVGTLTGAIAGGVAGNEVGKGRGRKVAIVAGTLLGAMLGEARGHDLDEADRIVAAQATQKALEGAREGERQPWRNPDSGNTGWIAPTRTWQHRDNGAYRREFKAVLTVGDEQQQGYGTACRKPDGRWQIVQPPA